jgi:hypothetical protein
LLVLTSEISNNERIIVCQLNQKTKHDNQKNRYEKNNFHTSLKKICKNHSGKIRQPIKRIHGWLYQSFGSCQRRALDLVPQTVDQDFQSKAYKYFFEEIQHMVNLEASVVKDVEEFVKTYKAPTVGVKELSIRECLDILYEVEDYFWGDRSGFDKIMHAQMVFAKELRKRLFNLSLD